jgi:hypothetical protein
MHSACDAERTDSTAVRVLGRRGGPHPPARPAGGPRAAKRPWRWAGTAPPASSARTPAYAPGRMSVPAPLAPRTARATAAAGTAAPCSAAGSTARAAPYPAALAIAAHHRVSVSRGAARPAADCVCAETRLGATAEVRMVISTAVLWIHSACLSHSAALSRRSRCPGGVLCCPLRGRVWCVVAQREVHVHLRLHAGKRHLSRMLALSRIALLPLTRKRDPIPRAPRQGHGRKETGTSRPPCLSGRCSSGVSAHTTTLRPQ